MFSYEVLRFQWIIAALGGGIVLLIGVILLYLPIWGPRTRAGSVGPEDSWLDVWHYIPWAVILVIAGTSAYAVFHAIIMGTSP